MADKAHKLAEKELEDIDKHLSEIYWQASMELTEKAKKYFDKFNELDAKKQALVKAGKMSADDYQKWKQSKIMTGNHWKAMKEQAALQLLHANEIAQAYINDKLPKVYSQNYNSIAQSVNSVVKGYSFEMVDASTVKNLAMSDKTLLPYKYVNGKKDVRWNTQKVNSAVLQGIIQGDSIPDLAKRLRGVTEMNRASAVRNARTAITSAENKGRMDMLHNAEAKGIKVAKVWLATNDGRTRDAHIDLNGQKRPVDEPFDSPLGKIMYPGDPEASPANTYNCRCTMVYKITSILGHELSLSKNSELDELFDKSPYENTSMTAMFYSLKDENKELGKEFWDTLQESGKPSEVWKKYLNGDLSADASKKIDSILAKYKGTGSPKKPISQKKLAAEKALSDAKDAQEKAQAALNSYGNKTYSGIWKNDVTLDDYDSKKGSIQAKMDYFLQKTASDPNNTKWDDLIQQLNEFQEKGEEYSKLKNELVIAKQKVWDLSGQSQKTGFESSYSKERKDAALWAKSPKEADGFLRNKTGEVWRNATPEERGAIFEYTKSFHKFNEPLRGIEYGTNRLLGVGKTDLNAGSARNGKKLNAMTRIINKCSYDFDIWMQRGTGYGGMDSFFGISESLLRNGTQEQLEKALINKSVVDFGFFSCGDSKGAGFSSNPIIMNVFAPKGTKMMYAEPFSAFGGGSGKNWDGFATQGYFGGEAEVILQQGTIFKITKIERSRPGGPIYIDVEVVGQGEVQKWVP